MRSLLRPFAVALGALALAACASGPPATTRSGEPHRAGGKPAAAVPAGSAAGAQVARSATEHEAARLLALVRLPAGRFTPASATSALSGPALGSPVSSSVIDRARFWRVDLPFARAMAWVRAHPPRGLTYSGSSSSRGPGGTTSGGFGWDDHDSRYWTGAELEVGIAPAGEETIWRIDGTALWLDPRAAPDGAPGPRLHVDPRASCPRTDRGEVGVAPTGATSRTALLGPGSPARALICRYAGLNGRPFMLLTQSRPGAATAQRLAVLARRISVAHLDGGVTSCPMDDGSVLIVAFGYPGGGSAALWVRTTGCSSVTNGRIGTAFGSSGSSAFLGAIQPR